MEQTQLVAWIGAILGALTIVVAVVLFLVERKRKKLAYTLNFEEVGFGPHVFGTDIKISASGRELACPHYLVLTMRNVGNEPVVVDDFEKGRPIRIHFAGSELIESEIRTHVPDLEVKVTDLEGGGIEIEPLLLKPGEGFALSALLEGQPTKARVEIRVTAEVRDETRDGPVSLAVLDALGGVTPTGVVGLADRIQRLIIRVVGSIVGMPHNSRNR